MKIKALTLCALWLVAPAVLAQQGPATPALSPQQQAELAKQDEQILSGSLQVIALIEAGRAGEVWDGSSEVTRALVARPDFIAGVTKDRQQVGQVLGRERVGITRTQHPEGGSAPAGYYVSVTYATRFANEKQPVRELVSFHLDRDNVWRVSGYTLR